MGNEGQKGRRWWRVSLLVAAVAIGVGGSDKPSVGADRDTSPGNGPVPRLKDVYANDFLIGTALDFRTPDEYSPKERDIIESQFNIITPENSMKPGSLHPAENEWNWTVADRLVDFCQAHHIQVAGHNLCWHAQTAAWMLQGENGQPLSRDVAIKRLHDHVVAVVNHFKGKLKGWDVVNEAIDDRNPSHGTTESLRNDSWYKVIGPDYLTVAFKAAQEADPTVELYYNDYNIERGDKHKSSMLLLKRLLSQGVKITAVGIQGHWSLTYHPYAELDQAIRDYASLGLKVNISELDVTIAGQGGGQLNPTPAAAPAGGAGGPATTRPAGRRGGFGGGMGRRGPAVPPTPEQLKAQADSYARYFQIFQAHKDVIERVTFWGTNDRRSWRVGQHPLLFDDDNNPKPALFAIAAAKVN